MKRLCVIGDPVEHSLSPKIQRILIREAGAAYTYDCCTVRRGELGDFMRRARAGEWAGCNVTMPHKQEILRYLDELTPQAQKIGAVNTVRFDRGRAIGHNTDGPGFVESLQRRGIDWQGKRVVLLGSGGAARAVAMTVGKDCRLTICNRTAEKAVQLAKESGGTAAEHITQPWDLLINATSCGMTQPFPTLDFLDFAAPNAAVCDLVYQPRHTPLLAACEERKLQTMNGLALLTAQAELSFAFFTGLPVETLAHPAWEILLG
jgi:shikimate dehydrogenase